MLKIPKRSSISPYFVSLCFCVIYYKVFRWSFISAVLCKKKVKSAESPFLEGEAVVKVNRGLLVT